MPSVLKSGQIFFQEFLRVGALEEFRWIADAGLARLQLFVVGGLIGLAGRNVADLLESERDRIAGPHVDRVAQDRVDRLGHVQVAHAAAGDARRAGARTALVHNDHIVAGAVTARLQGHGKVPGGRESMNTGADDDVADRCRQCSAHRMSFIYGWKVFPASSCHVASSFALTANRRHRGWQLCNNGSAQSSRVPSRVPNEH